MEAKQLHSTAERLSKAWIKWLPEVYRIKQTDPTQIDHIEKERN